MSGLCESLVDSLKLTLFSKFRSGCFLWEFQILRFSRSFIVILVEISEDSLKSDILKSL